MNQRRILRLIVPFIALFALAADTKPTVSQSPMDADQAAVYHAFLGSYSNGSKARLNLSKITSPFDLEEERGAACLRGIELDAKSQADSAVHEFDPQIVSTEKNIQLVDPQNQRKAVQSNDPGNAIRHGEDVDHAVAAGFASGLLTLSEVMFDKEHRYAVMNFSFVCGGLCGHGATVVFEKKNRQWKESKRQCSSWMS